jgi:pseudaminic acid cytidylyltransferase
LKPVAIIPARGGSKRIPKKNIIPILGIPMIGYAILAAQESELFEKIIVSTDSEEICAIAKTFGAEVPHYRSEELSNDYATTNDVMADAVNPVWIGESRPQHVCCIYATSPLLQATHLIDSYKLIIDEPVDYVFPATTFQHNVQRAFQLEEDGGLRMLFPEHLLTRSQDLQPAFHDVGQFYWGKTEAWAARNPIFNSNSRIMQVETNQFVDIDNFSDLELVIELLKSRRTLKME